ncbi:hypothetical protein QYE76_011006 [Lolium multiflorum]|uniref:Uncharacterized protein n=1 Tax=Lolium multiflorum TaxID=4521 RepID=A0AAD8X577_LOLMU|nr:hypothetical protein QYE76_011006 [Lolium multiflorum]
MEYSRLCRCGGDGHLEALTGDNIDLIAAHLDVTYTVRLAACSRELYDQISNDEGKMHHWDEPCLLMPPPAYWFDDPWFVATASRLHVTVYDLVPLDHPRRSVTLPFMHDRKWLGANGDWIAAADHHGCQWCLVNVYTERHIPLPSPPDPKIGHGVTYQPATKDWLYYLCWSRAINLLKIVICQVPTKGGRYADYKLIALFDKRIFYLEGGGDWRMLKNPTPEQIVPAFCDAIELGGQVFAVDEIRGWTYCWDTPNENPMSMFVIPPPVVDDQQYAWFLAPSADGKRLMIILTVNNIGIANAEVPHDIPYAANGLQLRQYPPVATYVFEQDPISLFVAARAGDFHWRQVNSLGDHSLFLGLNYPIIANLKKRESKAPDGTLVPFMRKNCVYTAYRKYLHNQYPKILRCNLQPDEAPQQQGSPAYVVYKVGGDPGDYQFLYEPPKEIPHGYVCTYVPDCNNWMTQVTAGRTATAGGVAGAGSSSGADAEKQAWLTKYATSTSHERSTSAAPTVDEITAIMRDQFGILPKKRMIGYSKPYPNDYDLIPLPPKYRLPDFTKFSGSEGTSSIEHVSRYLAQLGMVSASDELRVRFFSQSLTGPAFGWYTSLLPDSVRTWKQLEEQFHVQYHSETTEASLADLTQVRQRRGETVSEYIQRFRTVRNRCYSVRLSEKEAVELAIAGLSAPLRDVTFQAEYNSLAHMVQKLTAYEQRHPELYQDKYKRVALIETDEDEDSAGDQEVAVAEWTRGAKPVSCKWVKQPGPVKGFDFDLSKTEQIFDLLLKEKQLKLPEGHKIPTPQEMNGKPYCKWHHTFTHTTNDCKVLRGQIQMAIEQGRLLFGQFAMRVDTQPFPEVNMVDLSHCIGREPGFSFDINMAGLADRHGEDKPESSRSRGKGEEEADPHDRPQTMKSGESSVSITMEKEADSSDRLKPTSTRLLPVRDMDLAGDGKLGYGFTSADELEEIEEVKKEIKKLLDAGFIRPCRYAEWISNVIPTGASILVDSVGPPRAEVCRTAASFP